LAFRCWTRNFCSSCQAKRSVLFAEKIAGEILAPVPHRHWTFSISKVLRGLFERERSLLSLLSQTAYASIVKSYQALLGRKGGPVAFCLFRHAESMAQTSILIVMVMQLFRRLLLLRLRQAERISESFMQNLMSWIHPGFSVYAGPPVQAFEIASLESQAGWQHGLLNSFGLIVNAEKSNVADVAFSLFSMSSQFVTVIGVLCATWLGMKYGKKTIALAGYSLAGIFMAMHILLSSDSIGAVFALEYLRAICFAPAIPLLWAMFADVVECRGFLDPDHEQGNTILCCWDPPRTSAG
jgi:hypothetical protein